MSEEEQTKDGGAESAVSQTYLTDELVRETHALAESILSETEQVAVSHTHLTLPTKRIV